MCQLLAKLVVLLTISGIAIHAAQAYAAPPQAESDAVAENPEAHADSTDATDDDADEAWAHLKGRFAYDGERPQPKTFDTRTAGNVEVIDESLAVDEHGGLANVVVVVVTKNLAVHPDYAATDDAVVRIRSKAFRFEPHVAKIRVSQTLEFQNADVQAHNFNLAPVGDQPIQVLLQAGAGAVYHFHRSQRLPTPVSDNIYISMTTRASWNFSTTP